MSEKEYNGTSFSAIYNRFLSTKVTDDMYMEITPEETIRDLQHILIDAIPGFEFPRVQLTDNYIIETAIKNEEDVEEDEFILSVIWNELAEDDDSSDTATKVVVEKSRFAVTLSEEEQNILAILMKQVWVQRQVATIENTRMKYTGSDFKMTSQANHLSKLLDLLEEARRDSFHMQRLYKRRKVRDDGTYQSNWSILRSSHYGKS